MLCAWVCLQHAQALPEDESFVFLLCLPGFLRKVYGILCAQLVLTTAVAAAFITVEPLKQFAQTSFVMSSATSPCWLRSFLLRRSLMFFTVAIASFASLFALIAYRHQHPLNMKLLVLFVSAIAEKL